MLVFRSRGLIWNRFRTCDQDTTLADEDVIYGAQDIESGHKLGCEKMVQKDTRMSDRKLIGSALVTLSSFCLRPNRISATAGV